MLLNWLQHRWPSNTDNMKAIENGSLNDTTWNSELIRDLAFIKKHLRYRLSKKIILRSTGIGFVFVLLIRLGSTLWLVDRSKAFQNPIMWLLLIVVAAAILFPIVSYFQVLKFKVISTPYLSAENQEIVKQFLTSMHLALSRHPEAPEIFQIMSRNISGGGKEQREIMIFIADVRRILVNSHYSRGGFNILPPSYNYRQMAKQLQKFVDNYSAKLKGAIVSINN